MRRDWYSLDELAAHLGRDRREIEKLVNRGRIPGRKVAGQWQFHPTEITHWLEQELREYTDRELAQLERQNQTEEIAVGTPLTSLLKPETVAIPLEARTKRSLLEGLVEVAGRTWQVWEPATVLTAVQQRESVMSTAFDNGVAIPHPRNPLPDAIGQSIVVFGRTLNGIPFGAANGSLSDMFFLVLCRDSRTHLHALARIGRLIQNAELISALRQTDDALSAYDLLAEADRNLPE